MSNTDPYISNAQYLQILNAVARTLNGTVKLQSMLDQTLRQTIDMLGLRTGWIWLVNPGSRSVYLAASHHLPPALAKHPERLSGWCYCIDKYLTNDLEATVNISEITCTRLKDLKEGTEGLQYHASIPLLTDQHKVGIMNVVHQQSQELTDSQLQLLHTIGELLGMAIGRTYQYENSRKVGAAEERKRLVGRLQDHLLPGLDALQTKAKAMQGWLDHQEMERLQQALRQTQQLLSEMRNATRRSLSELEEPITASKKTPAIQYPTVPLTERELEVLQYLQKGNSNKAVATALFISERTVKFHVSAILQKLNATNRTEAVQIALQRGILSL